ncbi:hypothetical protein HCU74_18735 [Spongiibacter sp. KMU-166]|uniref:Uncharacterized protein n=1 Tax=Spongiibacter thalassae TaxID=2721624 RepID=A0ABX1GLV4_9GAMM|nr:hypothetical protein [Spongiibacter thalassae]NKI19448.1 hypothetical protein [Spongiibacter thalassae]
MTEDQQKSLKMLAVVAALLVLLGLAVALTMPLLSGFIDTHFAPGLGMRDAAVISFFVTVITLVVFAVAAGDGLLGELQFILGGFFSFFLIFWLMLAWIF